MPAVKSCPYGLYHFFSCQYNLLSSLVSSDINCPESYVLTCVITCCVAASYAISAGRRKLLQCLLSIQSTLNSSEPYYVLNNLYITDYCVWIQKTRFFLLTAVPRYQTLYILRIPVVLYTHILSVFVVRYFDMLMHVLCT